MKNPFFLLIVVFIFFLNCSKDEPVAENPMYFPPINSDVWETTSIQDLGWNANALQPLLNFLEVKKTKSFMILHNGKIVREDYFNNHSQNDFWYWASAGKTLTTAVSGIAQDEGLIHINTKVSDYLGTGWTSIPVAKENLITCKNLLSMTSGLDANLGDDVSPSNLRYVADAGSIWAYHNVYVKMQDVIATASNKPWSTYFNNKLRDKIGMSGIWLNSGSTGALSVYWSNTRSMARFGLLVSAKGTWNTTQIVSKDFLDDATNTSQNNNKAYGYLWWLNGKTSYQLPQSRVQFNGELIPNAPEDMYAALGKNDQKIYIVPSKKLVIIRMGESGDGTNFALSNFDNELWEKINALVD